MMRTEDHKTHLADSQFMRQILYIFTVLILTSCQSGNTWECEGDCNNGYGIKKWKDGGIERGTWKNGELTGRGYQLFGKNSEFAGDNYQGEFLHGYHGYGKYTDVSEDATYIGFFKNGKHDGKGKLTFGRNSSSPNSYYDGDWKNGMPNGYGVKFWPDQGTYIGSWENGDQHGEGIFIFLNGDTLRGLWFQGYCKDLAVLKTGKDASYFKSCFNEITYYSTKTNQRFIDATAIELINYQKNSSYSLKFPVLRKLLNPALENQRRIFSKFEEINEYDEKIPYKHDLLNVQFAVMDFLNECDKWINLNLESGDKWLIQDSYNSVLAKIRIMEEEQLKFEKTNKRFAEKYL